MKNTKIEKNNKALDSKVSSAFLLYGDKDDNGFYITQECYDKIMNIEFYRINKETGEEVKSKYLNYRTLCFVYDLHRISKENHVNENNSKLNGRNTLREYSYSYYKDILNKLLELGIITVKQNNDKAIREIWINEKFLSSEKIKLPNEYWVEHGIIKKKRRDRGNKLNSDNVYIDCTKEEFMDMCKDKEDFEEKKYLNLYNNILKINKTGELKATQKYQHRCYSLFSNLPSKIHSKTYIDGRKLSEIDGSATFFAFLPAVLDREIKIIQSRSNNSEKTLIFLENLIKDTAKLRKIIKETSDIYSLFVDETHTRDMIKTSVNSYLNDKNSNFMYSSIKKWFNQNIPTVNTIIRQFSKKNKFFYKIQQVEIEVYGYVAKTLKKENLPVILKHDCILTYSEHIEYVKKLLVDIMTKLNITQHFKEKHYEVACGDPSDLSSSKVVSDKKLQSSNVDNPSEFFYTPFVDDRKSLSDTKRREKEISIRPHRKGFQISIKSKKYYSTSKETKLEFYERLMNNEEISKDVKKLIKFNE